jgi:hypothetical protein
MERSIGAHLSGLILAGQRFAGMILLPIWFGGRDMAGKSPLRATGPERLALAALAGSGACGEADRARAVLLTVAWSTSNRISHAFGVREDTVRLHCPAGDCMQSPRGMLILIFASLRASIVNRGAILDHRNGRIF